MGAPRPAPPRRRSGRFKLTGRPARVDGHPRAAGRGRGGARGRRQPGDVLWCSGVPAARPRRGDRRARRRWAVDGRGRHAGADGRALPGARRGRGVGGAARRPRLPAAAPRRARLRGAGRGRRRARQRGLLDVAAALRRGVRRARLNDAETLAFLRSLPAKRVDGEVKCLRDLFLRDAFYPLCGGLLPYAFERSDGADGFPSLSTTGAQATRCLVAKLVRADPSDAADARAALEVLAGATRKDGVFQAAAALYGVAATKLAAMNQPWVLVEEDEELQLELPTNCVWDDNEQLCELARAKRLAPFYAGSRGAEQALVAAGVEPKLGKCRDFLAILDALRGSVVEASDAASLSRECYRRFAEACVASTADRAACANSFVAQRLILVPKPGGAVLVALRADEAYWDVSAHLRHTALDHYALSHHFDASLRTFFVDVLGVNPELLEEPAVSSNGHTMPGTGEPSTIQDGLRSADLAAPPSTGAAGAAPTEALARAALARVAEGDAARLPPSFRAAAGLARRVRRRVPILGREPARGGHRGARSMRVPAGRLRDPLGRAHAAHPPRRHALPRHGAPARPRARSGGGPRSRARRVPPSAPRLRVSAFGGRAAAATGPGGSGRRSVRSPAAACAAAPAPARARPRVPPCLRPRAMPQRAACRFSHDHPSARCFGTRCSAQPRRS